MRRIGMVVKRILGVASVLALLATAPAASAEEKCGRCYDNEDGSAHVFGNAGWWISYMYADCNSFNSCHPDVQYGSCQSFHYGCGLLSAVLTERMNTSIVRGDVVRVGALIAANPGRVRFSPSSGQVAVLDCDRKVLMTWDFNAHSSRALAFRGNPSTKLHNDRRVG
jgi:hypothetical protein